MNGTKATRDFSSRKIDLLLLRKDSRGRRVPFALRYQARDGTRVESGNVICTSVDHARGIANVQFLDTMDAHGNCETRTLRICLIIQIDEYLILKN